MKQFKVTASYLEQQGLPLSIVERFWSKVELGEVPAHCPELGRCWNWNGSVGHNGYGHLAIAKGQNGRAHRISWLLNVGPIPHGQWVLHACDNRKCVRDTHLWLGSQQDNNLDMKVKGRGRGCSRPGEANPASRLCREQVKAIRSITNLSQRDIAELYGVSQSMVSLIVRGARWSFCS